MYEELAKVADIGKIASSDGRVVPRTSVVKIDDELPGFGIRDRALNV